MGTTIKTENKLKKIVELLESQGPIKRTEIEKRLDIPKGSMSGYLKTLVQRNKIKIGAKGAPIEILETDEYPGLNAEILSEWIILYFLSISTGSLRVSEIQEKYLQLSKELFTPCKKMASIYKYLNSLLNQGYIEETSKIITKQDGVSMTVSSYKTTSLAPAILHKNYDELLNLFHTLKLYNVSAASNSFAEKIQWILDIDNSEVLQQQVYGKLNQFKKQSLEQLNLLFSTAYRTKKIRITYNTKNNSLIEVLLSVGIVIYSAETNEFYLLGESDPNNQFTIIRLSSVKKIVCAEAKNDIYNSKKYKEISRSMVSVEYNEPFNVKIRFLNKPWIKERLENYVSQRENGHLDYEHNQGKEILYYEDGVIGLHGLHRFVRSFGPNAIVVEPTQLIDLMINSSERIEELYSEVLI